ncbi:hypothetical protein WICPIJ_001366 [Wickerhamomyces pijperi]|uniref:Pre-mRNA-processing factor 39 n=1 Tax=Wickerhamomyces pijperi TaxID=599730 RepID=A0A9P8TQV1_WICPI|nr:hypothetical protein WICPIJ_001366 [Wickerhamomyces pijperi]
MSSASIPSATQPQQSLTIDPLFLESNPQWKEARTKVDTNPTDLTSWNTLISETEALVLKYTPMTTEVKAVIEMTFDELLTRFPLFFGYWKKYTSIQYQINGLEASIATLSRSLDAFPYSIDLWIDYLNLLISNYLRSDKAKIRRSFMQAAKFIGPGFLSHDFWDKYLEFELNDDRVNFMKVLLHVIKMPLHQYARYYQRFLEVMDDFDLDGLIELEGESLVIPEDLKNNYEARKSFVKEYFNSVFLSTQEYVSQVWPFESNIKQSYFNLQPVSEEEEENWTKYLDFQIEKYKNKPSNIVKSIVISTFERSLIPNALATKFWKKYLAWYTSTFPKDFNEIDAIYRKACNLYIETKTFDIRLNYALFLQVNRQNEDQIHEIYLSTIKQNPLEFRPIISYIKFLSRTQGYTTLVKKLDDMFQNYQKSNEYKPINDPYMRRLRVLLNDRTIGIILTESLKIQWLYLNNAQTVKAQILKLIYDRRTVSFLDGCIPFYTMAYNFLKSIGDLKQLHRVVKTIKYEVSLPPGIISSILKDHQSYIRCNINDMDIYNPYVDALGHTLDIHNPVESSKFYEDGSKQRKREWGHPGVLNDTPEVTNADPYGLVSAVEVKGVPTFKNVEKAALPVEYLANE